ncbi:hypothetical protein EFR01_18560 [Sinorhizobium fredii]|nr:hypothetical protein EFR01_18560 [Sinorhizobium fredii]GLS09008.1 hypothetical protein GCM10007864_26380 [Sinorhizobium fredii]
MAHFWRGDFYGQSDNVLGGARLMVLGEAHYHHSAPIGSDIPEMTKDVVNAYVEGRLGANAQFFRRVERLVTKRLISGLTRDQSAAFWHSVIFSNYIPVIAGNKPGDRPPEGLWNGAAPHDFIENVKRTEAEIVLVCGTELWRRKPVHKAISTAYKAGGRHYEAHEINWSPEWGAVAAHIPHPSGSRGWSYKRCVPVVDYLFNVLNERRLAKGLQALVVHPVFAFANGQSSQESADAV